MGVSKIKHIQYMAGEVEKMYRRNRVQDERKEGERTQKDRKKITALVTTSRVDRTSASIGLWQSQHQTVSSVA